VKSITFNGVEVQPSKIVCIGRNYVEHILELDNEMPTEPVIFVKPNSSLSANITSNPAQPIHYESEICILIQGDEIRGIGIGLDLTKRETQSELKQKGLPWERAKAFDKSAVMSEFITCEQDLSHYTLELFINGKLTQKACYEHMMFKPQAIVDEISTFMTLEDNDIIMTGTPKGVGVINSGDRFEARLYYHKHVVVEQVWLAE
jgi:2-keto-4-pentenoate hydratase/2-oxohepta-3-ene-1,7-dioic acid hydratase in catechol pathway